MSDERDGALRLLSCWREWAKQTLSTMSAVQMDTMAYRASSFRDGPMRECLERMLTERDELLAEVDHLRARVAELEARRPVRCETCSGRGKLSGPGDSWMVCPDCGDDGCWPGVRWEK